MSEETKVETQTEATTEAQTPENQNVNISVDQILAAVLATIGEVKVTVESLVANYSTKQIKVDQMEDGSILFNLIDAPVQPEVADETKQVSE